MFSRKRVRLVHPALVNLLTARGGGLDALTLCGPSMPLQIADAVSVYCRGLRRLRIELDEWDPLTVALMLRRVGEGPTDLALVALKALEMITALNEAKTACAQLQRLEVRATKKWARFDANVADFIDGIIYRNSAGFRTLSLCAGMARVPLLESVAAQLQHVRLEAETTHPVAAGVLETAGSRLVSLKLSLFDESVTLREYDCSRLERLVVD